MTTAPSPRPSAKKEGALLEVEGITKRFGGLTALSDVGFAIERGEIYGLIGPNGAGKTTLFNVLTGLYRHDEGRLRFEGRELVNATPDGIARRGIARTFQTPRIVGEASVLQNVLIGGTIHGRARFAESLLALPRHRHDERTLEAQGLQALRAVGLEGLAAIRADRLQHSELRFLEIARALMLRPAFMLLDEPAAGLAADEIARLGTLVKEISRCGTGVLLVEHHADLIFEISDHITVLNLGRVLASGAPAEIRVHKEVVGAYLGG